MTTATIRYTILKALLLSVLFFIVYTSDVSAANLWEIQSVDTMKTSRDLTIYERYDPTFDEYIDHEMRLIVETGANYVTIDGAYDEEYLEWMRRWEKSARKHGLKVWYRGNFSGWHGWFGPKDMTRQQHYNATRAFIINNPDLFEDGDAFTPCPECEWGGPGNPVETKDFVGFRTFMIDEYVMMNEAFSSIGKDVHTNWFSMNPDVAKQVLDEKTVAQIGNVITLDYFVRDIGQLEEGLNYFHGRFPEAKILIGEFGAPIPEINGSMTEPEKAAFVRDIFELLRKRKEIIGINYWVSTRGATELFAKDFKKSDAYDVVVHYYKSSVLTGTVVDENGVPLPGITINSEDGYRLTSSDGSFAFVMPAGKIRLTIKNDSYNEYRKMYTLEEGEEETTQITLHTINKGFMQRVRELFDWLFLSLK